VAGTTSAAYAALNWPYILDPLSSPAGRRAEWEYLRSSEPVYSFAGHSFGAVIADALGSRYHRPAIGYGSPVPLLHAEVRDNIDPVAIFSLPQAASHFNLQPRFGHSLSQYGLHA